MPLWKKAAKCNRISKLVSDHLHNSPHKRGGSLVVETGFPTSLIDLFVKNRDRLKKSSKKKRSDPVPDSVPESVPTPICPSPISTPLATPSSSRRMSSPLVLPVSHGSGLGPPGVCDLASQRIRSLSQIGSDEVDEIQKGGVVGQGGGGGEGGGGGVAAASGVLVAILKVFLVVVLALGTKKFVVGITMSAFLLLFMEYAGKHVCRLLRPCLDAWKSLAQRSFCPFGIKRSKLIVKGDRGLMVQERVMSPVVSDRFGLIEGHKMDDPFREIQAVELNSNLGCSWLIEDRHKMNDPFQEIQIEQPSPDMVPPTREIQSVKREFDFRSGEEKWVREEVGERKEVMETDGAHTREVMKLKNLMEKDEEHDRDVVDLKSHRSRSGKIRSKIKKLISKKLHGSKKKRMGLKNEASSSTGDNNVVVTNAGKGHLEEEREQRGLEYDDKSSSLSSVWTGDQVDIVDGICSSSELSRVEMEDNLVREDVGRETDENSGKNLVYLILIVIVLVGLVWGRVLALVLALSWYLLLKSAGRLWRLVRGCPDEVSNCR